MRANNRDTTPAAPGLIVPPLLTIKQACEILQIGRATLYRMIARREIPAITASKGARRIVASDLQAYIRERQAEARGEIVLYATPPTVTHRQTNHQPRRRQGGTQKGAPREKSA